MNWQPIETAPKDGSRFLSYSSERCKRCPPWASGVSVIHWDGEWWMLTDGSHLHSPTHWIPLPEPPAEFFGAGDAGEK